MTTEEQNRRGDERDKTARTVGQLVKYSREVNQSDTVDEVGAYALEGTVNLMDGHPSPTVVEVHQGDLRVMKSMSPNIEAGGEPTEVAKRAYETEKIVVVADDSEKVAYSGDDVIVLDRSTFADEPENTAVTITAPSVYRDEVGEVGAIISARWPALDSVEEYHVKPLDYLADHVATAINNIRSRDRLERARNDLAKRKEMIEVYDRLLRHDLGNDLQVITGFSDALLSLVDDDDQTGEYAEKINRTAESAADLINRVGDLVKTLEQEEEPEPRDLEPILASVVEEVDAKFENLTTEFDPAEFDYRVYAGDLLDSIFTNVLSNAAVHNDQSITVEVYTEETGPDTVTVGFRDDGAGVAEEARDEIFEMGKKGPDSEGTGFGLGLARALTESYGGGVELRESEWGGADFRITLERA